MRQPSRLRHPVVVRVVAPAALLCAAVIGTPGRIDAQTVAQYDSGHAAMIAQSPMPSATGSVTSAAAHRVAAPAARIVAEYVVRHPRGSFPQAFTLSDSAGRLRAHYRLVDDATPREMRVDVVGADLVLRAETADGPLTVRLERQADSVPAGRAITGRWFYRGTDGVLQGRVQR